MSEIKTSKIKEVVEVKPFTNAHGTTLYHSLIMDNGDKINLGKKKEQQVGWELTYEITETGQQEFNKAKSAQQDGGVNYSRSNASNSYQRNQSSIIAQFAFREANLMLIHSGYPDGVNSTSQKLDFTTDVAEMILEKLSHLEQKAKDNGLG